jgi:hypothetical protein
MRASTRLLVGTIGAASAFMLGAGVASADECTNADQPVAAGAQVIINAQTGAIEWTTPGLAKRLSKGLVTPDGEGYHGIVGLDFDGDGQADINTYIVGPNGELPETAQQNGATCHGIVSIENLFTFCQV